MLKPIITASVGKNGVNIKSDIKIVQKLLNNHIKTIQPIDIQMPLKVDGIIGKNTINAITVFQKKVANMANPDGRVDPRGQTIRKLRSSSERNIPIEIQQTLCFPLKVRPEKDYKTSPRKFGASRSGGKRLHAGCDLYAKPETEILAMDDGKIIRFYEFYLGTYALEVDHGGFIARYGEISRVALGIQKNSIVKKGQIIAHVGELKFKSGTKLSMLHLEMYSGKAKGSLTNRSNKPYQRRSDLVDPTPFLDKALTTEIQQPLTLVF